MPVIHGLRGVASEAWPSRLLARPANLAVLRLPALGLRSAVRAKHNSPDLDGPVTMKDLQQLAVEWQLHRQAGFWDDNRTEDVLTAVSPRGASAPDRLASLHSCCALFGFVNVGTVCSTAGLVAACVG